MSEVRMCDKCGGIFSVLSDGWETYSATKSSVDERNRRITTQYQADACAECSTITAPMVHRPQLTDIPESIRRDIIEAAAREKAAHERAQTDRRGQETR